MKDSTLLVKICEVAKELHPASLEEVIKQVHNLILTKIYNARSNEFCKVSLRFRASTTTRLSM